MAAPTADGFSDTEIGRLMQKPGHRLAKTNSRPVTGSMNEHVWNSQHYFAQEGAIHSADAFRIKSLLNDTPMGALAPASHMEFPIKVLTCVTRPSGVA